MQIFSNSKVLRRKTPKDLKDFDSQSLATQAKQGEQLVFLMSVKKNFRFNG